VYVYSVLPTRSLALSDHRHVCHVVQVHTALLAPPHANVLVTSAPIRVVLVLAIASLATSISISTTIGTAAMLMAIVHQLHLIDVLMTKSAMLMVNVSLTTSRIVIPHVHLRPVPMVVVAAAHGIQSSECAYASTYHQLNLSAMIRVRALLQK
jgi:hypothetical protein